MLILLTKNCLKACALERCVLKKFHVAIDIDCKLVISGSASTWPNVCKITGTTVLLKLLSDKSHSCFPREEDLGENNRQSCLLERLIYILKAQQGRMPSLVLVNKEWYIWLDIASRNRCYPVIM